METCSNPGCDQPGTSKCSACKTTLYCGTNCQTTDWPRHKEECPGHLLKVGMAHLEKAKGFERERNFPQILRYSNLAATKLKQLKDLPVELIDEAMRLKFNALNFMDRNREALECAKDWYCLYLKNHTHPQAMRAGFALIKSCINNKEYAEALLYASTNWETITLSRDSHIPENRVQRFTAQGARLLAEALLHSAQSGGMPAEEKQNAGQEAITLTRRALDIHTQLYGAESEEAALDLGLLAQVLDYFNDVDDDEIPRLYEQVIAIYTRVQGSLSSNVAIGENSLGSAYFNRSRRACAANDLDREMANLELALPHYIESSRIHRVNNHVDKADRVAECVELIEQQMRYVAITKAEVN